MTKMTNFSYIVLRCSGTGTAIKKTGDVLDRLREGWENGIPYFEFVDVSHSRLVSL